MFFSLETIGPSDGLYVDYEGNNVIEKDSGGFYLNWVNQVTQRRGKTKGGISLKAWGLGTLFSYLKIPLRHPNFEMTSRQLGYTKLLLSEEVSAGISVACIARGPNKISCEEGVYIQ